MVRRHAVTVLVALFALAACGGDEFGRAEAIASLTATGLSSAEFTCVADSLAAGGELSAADPNQSRGELERDALVAAMSHCVTPETAEAREEASIRVQRQVDEDPEGTPIDGPASANRGEEALVYRAEAIAHLGLAGRSTENARCIVDQLIAANADDVLIDPAFGLGLDPREANAFATCL